MEKTFRRYLRAGKIAIRFRSLAIYGIKKAWFVTPANFYYNIIMQKSTFGLFSLVLSITSILLSIIAYILGSSLYVFVIPFISPSGSYSLLPFIILSILFVLSIISGMFSLIYEKDWNSQKTMAMIGIILSVLAFTLFYYNCYLWGFGCSQIEPYLFTPQDLNG
ncbi:hypothetical protein A3H65_02975 [Candidatus Giovannonibacteria bacterium RIFCSPLOWO2_02_FULL_45_14]|uniref:Uncharacterized protein n=1 Tax=Candidatus Giovannonibacteria bacterium RIFCSPLOWO2_12_FULL_44_15 TaxID=1798364 RepID=A0A1F5Y0G7_9BACT|nr:MAG: hypothetical protein A3H65_02975 [Candidatus Giovannonibacteria bacterium RIFCSPLOWO2_02_FULL_45_14]OGF93639.1 MAG: hypothetical protein A3G54_00475 [Candidatus Giovannonibacteria bacterium RIFCSPLOWO2_12_FULL_44_15]